MDSAEFKKIMELFEDYYAPCECGRFCRNVTAAILDALKTLMVHKNPRDRFDAHFMVKNAHFKGWRDAVEAMYNKTVFFDEKLPTAIFIKWLLTCGMSTFDYATLWNPVVAVSPDIEFVTCKGSGMGSGSCKKAGCIDFCRHNAYVVFGYSKDEHHKEVRMVMVPGGLRYGCAGSIDKLLKRLMHTKALVKKKANAFIDQNFLKKVNEGCKEAAKAKEAAESTPVSPVSPVSPPVSCNQLVLVNTDRKCDECGCFEDDNGLFQCSRCMRVFYCSVDCQKAAWKDHKPDCMPV